jgi:hypothetical protein
MRTLRLQIISMIGIIGAIIAVGITPHPLAASTA